MGMGGGEGGVRALPASCFPLPLLTRASPRRPISALVPQRTARCPARRCLLFVVVASAPAFTQDRRTTLQEMLNGAYEPWLHCIAQLVASAPFIFLSGLVYQSIFHWLVRGGEMRGSSM